MDLDLLSNDRLSETRDFHPVLPTGEIGDFYLTIRSTKHPDVSPLMRKLKRKLLNDKARVERQGRVWVEDEDNARLDDIELAHLLITGFGGAKRHGKELDVTAENISWIIENLDWARDQAITEAYREADFFTKQP